MKDSDKLKIKINILCQPVMELVVLRKDEYIYRQAEKNINGLYKKLREQYSEEEKKDLELFGLMAFQFARLYFLKKEESMQTEALINGFEDELDKLLENK